FGDSRIAGIWGSMALEARWLRWASERFRSRAGQEPEMGLEEFSSSLELGESFFAKRFFALLDSNGSGSVSREELLGSVDRLLHGNTTEKLQFLFQVYDVDGESRKSGIHNCIDWNSGIPAFPGSGSIEAEELLTVLRGSLRESSLAVPEERLQALSQALLQALDQDQSGSITFLELQEQLEEFLELLESLSSSASSWLKLLSPSPSEHWLCCFSWECCSDPESGCFSRESGEVKSCCLLAWVATSALLFALGALGHRERGPALALARDCGQSLNLNCALLAVSDTGDSGGDTKGTPGHSGGTPGKDWGDTEKGHRGDTGGRPGRAWHGAVAAFLLRAGPGAAPQTGLALLPLLLPLLLGSSPCVRRRGHFQVFYWSHLCYIPVWFLLLLHGPHFWKWFLIPGSLFFLEKVLGWARCQAGNLHILEAKLLPSKVTHLVIQRPESFRFQPGDYVYLNVPAVAAYVWHPFSISSAPEQLGTLWLHIRARGQWTSRLYEFFQRLEPEPEPPGRSWHQELLGFVGLGSEQRGGCGTPSWRIFTSEHAVLIGAGIGIMPFASILQSIMFQCVPRNLGCPSQGFPSFQVDFIWIIWDQQHLQWFLGLLAKLEMEQEELEPGGEREHPVHRSQEIPRPWSRAGSQPEPIVPGKFLELHLYMTSALAKGDVKALGLQLALELLAVQEQRDCISSLRSRTLPGRPDWAKLFGKLAAEQRGHIRVFFCSSAELARTVRGHCRRFGFGFSKENF
ncbi:NOX5 oxidase, partial [Spelaeornis formosus]|nr:NOX5 oxidase [Elachura formosa]